jgi:hypothetical protein
VALSQPRQIREPDGSGPSLTQRAFQMFTSGGSASSSNASPHNKSFNKLPSIVRGVDRQTDRQALRGAGAHADRQTEGLERCMLGPPLPSSPE